MYMYMYMDVYTSIGGESLAVAQNNYAVLWFKGKELNMVFGMLLSISRVVSDYTLYITYEKLFSTEYNNMHMYWSQYYVNYTIHCTV